ncbi:MAG: RidA family protein [Acidobacteriota bacterium]|nr:RidA family protein [Acidobacteriota bacterium]
MSRAFAALFVLAIVTAGLVAAEPERVVVPDLGRLPAFSHATVSSGGLIFVSGTLGTQAGSTELVSGGAGAETTRIIRNIEKILGQAGASLRDVAKCTVYLVDLDDFPAVNEAWMPFFGDHPPARAAVGVADLVLGARVEIECIATAP